MEIIIKLISFALIISLIVFPIYLLNQLHNRKAKYIIVRYFIICPIATFVLVLIIAWWSDFSNHLLLSHYGYDFDDMNNIERFQNVAPENLDRVKNLRISILGIGWPMKAFLFYPFCFIYLIIIYSVLAYKKSQQKSN